MSTLKKLLILIFLSNKTLKKPLSKDILIVDKDLSNLPMFYFKNITECLDTRFHIFPNRNLNLYIFDGQFRGLKKYKLPMGLLPVHGKRL